MIRLFVTINDAEMAANVGGDVERITKVFEVEQPEMEDFIRSNFHAYKGVIISHERK